MENKKKDIKNYASEVCLYIAGLSVTVIKHSSIFAKRLQRTFFCVWEGYFFPFQSYTYLREFGVGLANAGLLDGLFEFVGGDFAIL